MQKEKNGKSKKSSMTKSISAKECSSSNGKVSQTMKLLGNHWKDSKALQKQSEITGAIPMILRSRLHSQTQDPTCQDRHLNSQTLFLFHLNLTLMTFGNQFKTPSIPKQKYTSSPSILSKNPI